MTGINICDEPRIQESILLGFPGRSDNSIFINYCILYVKQFIYLERFKDSKEQNVLNRDFWGYLSQLKYQLKIEKKHVFAEIKISSSTSLILYMTIYRLYGYETLL